MPCRYTAPWRSLTLSVLMGAIGFGLGMMMVVPLLLAPHVLTWVVPLAMCGLGAGTGARLGDEEAGSFLMGIVGAVTGGLGGILVGLANSGFRVAGPAAIGLIVLMYLVGHFYRPTSGR